MPLALPKGAPLILLSPAKTLNFDVALPPALAAATPTHCRFLPRVSELVDATAALSRAQLKSTMRLSDTLAALNHERFRTFDEQPARVALAAFEGAAYKGIDAPSLDVDAVSYLQASPTSHTQASWGCGRRDGLERACPLRHPRRRSRAIGPPSPRLGRARCASCADSTACSAHSTRFGPTGSR